jgi:SAM-dependent methyltransferase
MSLLTLSALILLGGSSLFVCGLLLSPNWLLWELYGRVFDRTYRLLPRQKMLEQIHQSLQQLPGGARVLDFGSGTGMVEFYHQSRPGTQPLWFTAVEPTAAMRRAMERKALRDVTLISRDLGLNELLEFNHQFAAVLCVNVLYLLPNRQKVLQQFRQLLDADGVLILVVPMAGSSPTDYLVAHYNSRLARGGRAPWLWLEMAGMVLNLLLPGLIAVLIKLRERGGSYHFYEADELDRDLRAAGFQFDRFILTDGGNGWLVIGRRQDASPSPLPEVP